MNKAKVVDSAIELIRAARDLDPMDYIKTEDMVGVTPHLGVAVENIIGPVATTDQLQDLIVRIEKAKNNEEALRQVLAGVGVFVKTVLKIAICLVLVVSFGCANAPPVVREAHVVEGQAIDAYHENEKFMREAYHADLLLAFEVQIRLLEDFKLKQLEKDGKADVAEVQKVIEAMRAKRAVVQSTMDGYRGQWEKIEENYLIAKAIHAKIADYLNRSGVTAADATSLLEAVGNLLKKE